MTPDVKAVHVEIVPTHQFKYRFDYGCICINATIMRRRDAFMVRLPLWFNNFWKTSFLSSRVNYDVLTLVNSQDCNIGG